MSTPTEPQPMTKVEAAHDQLLLASELFFSRDPKGNLDRLMNLPDDAILTNTDHRAEYKIELCDDASRYYGCYATSLLGDMEEVAAFLTNNAERIAANAELILKGRFTQ